MRWAGLVLALLAMPIRIAQKLAGHDHGIRLFRPDDVAPPELESDSFHRAGHVPVSRRIRSANAVW